VAHPQIAAFARLAEGGAEPARRIEGQAAQLSRTMHGIAYDEIHDEIVVPQQFSQAILTFRGDANGEEAPIRRIQGPRTQLRRPDRVAVDAVHNEIFISDGGAVLVFPRDGDGDIAPIRRIRGPNTQLDTGGGGAPAIAVEPVNDVLVLLVTEGRILIFNRTDDGNVKPRAVISGPKTSLGGGSRTVTVYGGVILAHVGGRGRGGTFIGVWSIHDNGDIPPRWRFGEGLLQAPRGLTVDAKNKSVIVTDKRLNAVLTYYVPEIFEAG